MISSFKTIMIAALAFPFLSATASTAAARGYAVGADLSWLKQAEDAGVVLKDDGEPKPGLQIFRDHGYNWIRLRLFHTPTELPNDLEYTLAMAKEAKARGFKILLNFHYSDTWADPGKQYIPSAWENLSADELVDAVFEYTRETIVAFREAGVMPDMVQHGNEVIGGMLWPHGKIPENWDRFAALVKAGIDGMDAAVGDAHRPEVMVHIDRAADLPATRWFFDKFHTYGIDYDVIGQSYYPWWHGSLLDMRENFAFMANTYNKDIILVEVAYNWYPMEYIGKRAPFPESPEGQAEFLDEVNRIVMNTPNNRGQGIFWWEPVWPGGRGSRGMFDYEGNALPSVAVFNKFTLGRTEAEPD
jgi:arabinogalactan endo-1,4-beta-galactosidase